MRKRILIVEDNEDVALGLTVRFAGAGFDVRSVTSADDGLKAIDLFEPNLVLLDLLVPGGGGFSVLKALRRSSNARDVPVIVMTGVEDQDYKEKIRALGVNAFLEKPCDPDELMGMSRELLEIAPRIEDKILVKSRARRRGRAKIQD